MRNGRMRKFGCCHAKRPEVGGPRGVVGGNAEPLLRAADELPARRRGPAADHHVDGGGGGE